MCLTGAGGFFSCAMLLFSHLIYNWLISYLRPSLNPLIHHFKLSIMTSEQLPSLRPLSEVPKEGHIDPRTTEYPSIKLVLEPNVDKAASHKAAWAFYHQEHKREIDILASSLEELRLLKNTLSHDHQVTTQILASLLEEVRQMKDLFHASQILSVRPI